MPEVGRDVDRVGPVVSFAALKCFYCPACRIQHAHLALPETLFIARYRCPVCGLECILTRTMANVVIRSLKEIDAKNPVPDSSTRAIPIKNPAVC